MIKVNGYSYPHKEGLTVAELLKLLGLEKDYSIIRIGEVTITKPDFEKTVIPDGAEVFLIALLAGG